MNIKEENTMKTGKGRVRYEDERRMGIGTTKGRWWEGNVDKDGRKQPVPDRLCLMVVGLEVQRGNRATTEDSGALNAARRPPF